MAQKYLDEYIYSKNNILTFHKCVKDHNGIIWVYSNRMSAQFCIDVDKNESYFIGWNKKCDMYGYGADVVGIYNNNIINITRNSSYVEVVNINTMSCKYVLLKFDGIKENDKYSSVIVGDKLYLVDYSINEIFIFELEQILTNEEVSAKRINIENFGKDVLLKIIIIQNKLCLLIRNKPSLIVFNTDNLAIDFYHIQDIGNEIVDIVVERDKVYTLSSEGNIIIFDSVTRQQLKSIVNDEVRATGKYAKLILTQEYLWIFPSSNDDVFIVDKNKYIFKKFSEYPRDFQFQFPSFHQKYSNFWEDENCFYVGQRSANYVWIIDKSKNTVTFKQVTFPKNFFEKQYAEHIIEKSVENNLVVDETNVKLGTFLKFIENYI